MMEERKKIEKKKKEDEEREIQNEIIYSDPYYALAMEKHIGIYGNINIDNIMIHRLYSSKIQKQQIKHKNNEIKIEIDNENKNEEKTILDIGWYKNRNLWVNGSKIEKPIDDKKDKEENEDENIKSNTPKRKRE